MRYAVAGILAALLAGCTTPPREVALEGLNLADGTTLAALQSALPPDDRAALGTYALLHWPKSKFYCGEPIGGGRTLAATIGEAIEQTRAYEARLARAQAQVQPTALQSASADETALITRMERLVLERDMLYGRLGPSAATSSEMLTIKRQLTAMRGELAQLRGETVS